MTSDTVEPRPWPVRRWWIAIAIVFALQVGLVTWLEDRSPVRPRRAAAAPAFRFGDNRMDELLMVEDPTLFALPHLEGFSGEAWLKIPSLGFRATDWSEPARLLPPEIPELAGAFRNFVQTNGPPSFLAIAIVKPEWIVPENFSVAPPPAASRLRIEGELAKRRLLSAPPLQPWANSDLLTNSIVQVLVDAQGNPVSAVLLRPGLTPSAPKQEEANQRALELARAARFEPARPRTRPNPGKPASGLSIGTMIFEWQTILVSSTNAPPVTP
jgi:hypothetical protein